MKKLGLLLFAFILFACSSSSDDDSVDSSKTTYKLKLDTSYTDSATFSQISLPNHNFTISKEVETFTIDKELSLTNDVRTTINFTCVSKSSSKDVLVNFYKDQTTVIKLTKLLQSSGGCSLTFVITYE